MTFEFEKAGEGKLDSRQALDQLFSIAYEELRRLAATIRRGDPSNTLSPTALVNEAWLKLANYPAFTDMSQLHFKRIAARAMRELLIEAARRRNSLKRGGPDRWLFVSFDESAGDGVAADEDMLALDAALNELARLNPRQALLVESRYFGGLDVPELAALLEVSETTVLRDWRVAKAWLSQELRRSR